MGIFENQVKKARIPIPKIPKRTFLPPTRSQVYLLLLCWTNHLNWRVNEFKCSLDDNLVPRRRCTTYTPTTIRYRMLWRRQDITMVTIVVTMVTIVVTMVTIVLTMVTPLVTILTFFLPCSLGLKKSARCECGIWWLEYTWFSEFKYQLLSC